MGHIKGKRFAGILAVGLLATAGMGIAFNAKPVVQQEAEVAVNVPFLDAVLFMLGIRREEIERADADDPALDLPAPPPVPL